MTTLTSRNVTPDETVPDTDQAGTGRTGRPKASGVRSDQPVPHEPVD